MTRLAADMSVIIHLTGRVPIRHPVRFVCLDGEQAAEEDAQSGDSLHDVGTEG